MKTKPVAQNSKPAVSAKSREFFAIALLMAVLLALLFWRSFLPDYVAFSNDNPLGVQHSAWLHLPEGMTGQWYDLNSIGVNAGESSPDLITLLRWQLGSVGYAKFHAPVALWILGMSAWFFFRQLKFSSLAAVLGGLAAMLASAFFSDACWGLESHEVAIGMDFCALGLFAANSPQTSAPVRWARLALAGLVVGINVMEGGDIGAILSVFVALFVFFKSLMEENAALALRIGRSIARVAIIAVFAGFIAAQIVIGLVSTSIVGIAGTAQDAETKANRWDFATQWSLPKKETFGLFVPGLFGYRMDTPKDMMPALQDAYKAGDYWGGIGRTPVLDRYFDSGSQDPTPSGPGIIMRFSGAGGYIWILVALIAAWAIAQSLRRQNSVFTPPQRKFIWLSAIVLFGSLLLAWGRFAPFYQFLYALPYASTIRNPAKFIVVFSWVTVILFGYGVHGLSKLYLQTAPTSPAQLKNWWSKVHGFDRRWIQFSIATVIASALGWLIYASEKPSLVAYLEKVGFPDKDQMAGMANQIAAFSIGQAGWLVLFFALSVGLVILIIAGVFSGRRARLGGILLGALLVLDLGRANLPWIIHWDYKQKYEINSLNPIVEFLAEKPYEHRVAALPFPAPEQLQLFGELYGIEWMQHLFPYYNVQSLDKIQMPREPADLEAFERTFFPRDANSVYLIARNWQLTNTRYLLGPTGFLDVINSELDPVQHRFRVARRFSVVLKPGVEQFHQRLEELTAVSNDNGEYALFDFTGALPRAKLYTDWQANSAADLSGFTTNGLSAEDLYVFGEAGTNGFLTLKKLASPSFDPEKTVLLDASLPEANPSAATNQNPGTVEFKRYDPEDPAFKGKKNVFWKKAGYCYAPKDIMFDTTASAPSILLLNDKFDPNWSVTVDGKPAPMLHCNFIMCGVYLAPGAHTVEFRFALPNGLLYVTVAATGVGILLIGFIIFRQRKSRFPDKKQLQ
jgi:hypothetical protein